jgi:hypothetical protein
MVAGVLRAFEEREEGAGWVDAELPVGSIAPGVRVRRSLVAMPDYSLERLEWASVRELRFELPLHFAAELSPEREWTRGALDGSPVPEDGFVFAHDSSYCDIGPHEVVELRRGGSTFGWALSDVSLQWWRATAPGAPGKGESEFFVLRMSDTHGTLHFVWNWSTAIRAVAPLEGSVSIVLADGSRHVHDGRGDHWEVELHGSDGARRISLAGVRPVVPAQIGSSNDARAARPDTDEAYAASAARPPAMLAPGVAALFNLGRDAYRTSEESWEEAGRPRADVALRIVGDSLKVNVDVVKSPLSFRAADAPDPFLDNEDPDINSDGVQLHLYVPQGRGLASWLAVPDAGGRVRVHPGSGTGADVPLAAGWHLTADGYAMSLAIPLAALGARRGSVIGAQVVINDMAPARTRRRGQLVLAGGAGERVYLRGDRESPIVFARFLLGDV